VASFELQLTALRYRLCIASRTVAPMTDFDALDAPVPNRRLDVILLVCAVLLVGMGLLAFLLI
jgi:hypothetical protein